MELKKKKIQKENTINKLFKINDKNKKNKPKWKNSVNVEKFQIAEDSIPSENFTVKQFDIKGSIADKLVTEITIMRGSEDDCIGWIQH